MDEEKDLEVLSELASNYTRELLQLGINNQLADLSKAPYTLACCIIYQHVQVLHKFLETNPNTTIIPDAINHVYETIEQLNDLVQILMEFNEKKVQTKFI